MHKSKMNFFLGMITGGGLLGAGLLLGGMNQPGGGDASFNKITAQEISIADYRGRQEYMNFKSTPTGGLITIFDRDGKQVLAMGVTRLAPPTGNTQDQPPEEHSFTGIIDIQSSEGAVLVRNAGNTYGGVVQVNNVQGRNTSTMGVRDTGDGIIAAADRGGKPVALIFGTPQGGLFQSQDRRDNVLGRIP